MTKSNFNEVLVKGVIADHIKAVARLHDIEPERLVVILRELADLLTIK